ncbi:hypothetical protein IG631_08120 [Alternaria alternata]|nr:hypothetical protein IG631_08120 [Alternaria alternata]
MGKTTCEILTLVAEPMCNASVLFGVLAHSSIALPRYATPAGFLRPSIPVNLFSQAKPGSL